MPKPHSNRDKFLKYLRSSLAHDQPWVDTSGIYLASDVRAAFERVKIKDPILYKALHYYITTRMPRIQIADAVGYDSSTVKRKLDDGVDCILHNLKIPPDPES